MAGFDPRSVIDAFGLVGVGAVVFAESGVLVGFMLPGDSLLFTAGLLCSQGRLAPLPALLGVLFVAAVLGDQVGYLIGRKAGPALFRRPDSRVFNQANAERAQRFFERHGPRAIVLARFLPILRGLAPIVAGVGKMPYRTFVSYNIVGALAWAVGVTTLGYTLGSTVPNVDHFLLPIIGVIVCLSATPVLLEVRRGRRVEETETK